MEEGSKYLLVIVQSKLTSLKVWSLVTNAKKIDWNILIKNNSTNVENWHFFYFFSLYAFFQHILAFLKCYGNGLNVEKNLKNISTNGENHKKK